ncbi:Hypp731 [Branchiostoma lanceolatum]|uniref:Hypp731 protein n=1 Tax=Branchiostoma lanceolatum TaxID=7740 RepID=A0A8J9VCV8_BRALA|nr:Hypp731 [Branchiostoma lanceolatum]
MKCCKEFSVRPLVVIFCVLACGCTAVPTWQPTWLPTYRPGGHGCDDGGRVYSRGEVIAEVPGCMGYGRYCNDNDEIISWDNFGIGCCEHEGQYYEDGETVTVEGVTCHCKGSEDIEPDPMICTGSSTAPVITTTTTAPQTAGVEQEADKMQVWYDNFTQLMAEMLVAVEKLGQCSAGPAASAKGT